MRIIRPRPEKELVNLTPLIDVVFNLLIFFMLTGTMASADLLKVDPVSSTSRTRGDAGDNVILIDAKGRIALGDRLIARERLPDVIRKMLTANPEALIELKPDMQADAALVIDVMEQVRSGGAEYVVLLTTVPGDRSRT